MHPRRIAATFLSAAVLWIVASTTSGQSPPLKLPPDLPPPDGVPSGKQIVPVTGSTPISTATKAPAKTLSPFDKVKNDSGLTLVGTQLLPVLERGGDFLLRANQPTGRFINGWIPSLNRRLEGESFLIQANSAFALARFARFTGDERTRIRALQAVLALLSETTVDDKNPNVRYTVHAAIKNNRLAGTGAALMALGELPEPAADLVQKGEELAQYLKLQQKADGSLSLGEGAENLSESETWTATGFALYGIAQSLRLKPAAWKVEYLKNAAAHYRKVFQSKPHPSFIPWATAAYAQGFEASKEGVFAECVLEMNDWLCRLQYTQADALHPDWRGGFPGFEKGQPVRSRPDCSAAIYCQGLADACRVLRLLPKADLDRYGKYRDCLQRGLQFAAGLQYARENLRHFEPKFAEAIEGGFFVSGQDGNIRIEHTAWAVSAAVQFYQVGAARD